VDYVAVTNVELQLSVTANNYFKTKFSRVGLGEAINTG